MNQENNS